MVGFGAIRKVAVSSLAALVVWQARPAAAQFNFDTGNSGIDVIIPAVIPALAQTTSLNDAPIILRHTTLITNAWFDAIAPYHPTAVGVYSRWDGAPRPKPRRTGTRTSRCSTPTTGSSTGSCRALPRTGGR